MGVIVVLDRIGYAILDRLSKTAFWEWFTKYFLSGTTTRVYGYPKFPMKDFFKIVDLMVRGRLYAFVCSDYLSVGSIAIRTVDDFIFTHAGMILNDGDRTTRVMHMRSDGLHLDHMLTLLREVDYFAVVEIPLNSPESLFVAMQRMNKMWENRDVLLYDFEERLGNDPNKVYCSEFVLNICGDICVEKPKTQIILGREVFAPDNILGIGSVIYTNHSDVAKKYLPIIGGEHR